MGSSNLVTSNTHLDDSSSPMLNGVDILVVDDEESICRSLQCILEDEGCTVRVAASGEEGLELVRQKPPHLVLLDIWMAGKDGIETLKELQEFAPELPVIMMSGHATIATAMQATKLGATDFIEKPLDLNSTLSLLKKTLIPLEEAQAPNSGEAISASGSALETIEQEEGELIPLVFPDVALRGAVFKQRTLKKGFVVYGHGVHTGQKSGLVVEPLPENSGIHFVGMTGGTPVPAHVNFVESTGYATTLKHGGTAVSTVEHLMSALAVYGISNLLIKCNGEVPVLDGSSREFCQLIEEAGVLEQSAPWYGIKIKEPITIGEGKEFIRLEPADEFSIHYTLDYPAPLGRQEFEFTVGDIEAYKREIAPARTFGFVRDIEKLQTAGLAQGGRFDNFVLYGEEGTINVDLRFDNEAVRHKILDAIGDLSMLGRPLQGRITASMTGHSDNILLLRAIEALMQ